MSDKVVLYQKSTGKRFERWPVDDAAALAAEAGAGKVEEPAAAVTAETPAAEKPKAKRPKKK